MSLIDLLLAGVMMLAIRKSVQASREHRPLGLTRNVVAFMVAMLLHPYIATYLGTTSLPAQVESVLDVAIVLPAGPGSEVARGLMWLRGADLPESITQAIRDVWLSDISADVKVMTAAARRVVAKAILNLTCFVVLFMVVRWLLNLTGIHVIKALPPSLARGSRALGLVLGIAQSIVVCVILVAIIAPLVVTGLLPTLLGEHFRHSRLADVFLSLLHHLNLYRL